jgi:hypothetical protein
MKLIADPEGVLESAPARLEAMRGGLRGGAVALLSAGERSQVLERATAS